MELEFELFFKFEDFRGKQESLIIESLYFLVIQRVI